MANIKAAKKDIKRNARNRSRNLSNKTQMKSAIKAAYAAIESKDANQLTIVRNTLSIIDKSVSKGILNKNTAARTKSKLALANNKGATTPAPVTATKKAAPKKAAAKKAPAAAKS